MPTELETLYDKLYREHERAEQLVEELAILRVQHGRADDMVTDLLTERNQLQEQVKLAMAEAQDVRERWIPECDRLRLLAYQMQTTLEMLYNCGEHPDVKALDIALQVIEKAREALAPSRRP